MKATTDIEQGPTGSSQVSLAKYLEQQRARIDAELERLLPPEAEPPATIHRAMRYIVFAGGKRIRPIFCLAAAEAVAGGAEAADGVPNIEAIASTLELIHAYPLTHNDLPARDNDDYRRG